MTTALVAGAGGFIGGHLVLSLLSDGYQVRAVDLKPVTDWWQRHNDASNLQLDLSRREDAEAATEGIDEVFNLASDMGGMGFIELNKTLCMLNVLTNTHLLMAARLQHVRRFFFSSTACVYPVPLQTGSEPIALRESDAHPADPEDGYGWEKLFSERMCRHFREDFGVETRIARYHNVYGPMGTYTGGREKVPAAIARKVAIAKLTGCHEIEIWGDGEQVRSFTFIDDCIDGTRLITASDHSEPLNVGSSEIVTINQLVSMVESIAGVTLRRSYEPDAPQGVRGRNSDNSEIERLLAWSPSTRLIDGLERMFAWVYDQVANHADLTVRSTG